MAVKEVTPAASYSLDREAVTTSGTMLNIRPAFYTGSFANSSVQPIYVYLYLRKGVMQIPLGLGTVVNIKNFYIEKIFVKTTAGTGLLTLDLIGTEEQLGNPEISVTGAYAPKQSSVGYFSSGSVGAGSYVDLINVSGAGYLDSWQGEYFGVPIAGFAFEFFIDNDTTTPTFTLTGAGLASLVGYAGPTTTYHEGSVVSFTEYDSTNNHWAFSFFSKLHFNRSFRLRLRNNWTSGMSFATFINVVITT
jgi:hypothetical protein